MSLIRWSRPRSALSAFDEMDRMFRDMARAPWAALAQAGQYEVGPAVDVYETEDEVVVKAAVPGVTKEALEVNATEEGLTIHGETKREEKVEEEGYHLRELRWGSFHRVIPWPAAIEAEKVKAKFEDGILTVTAPKAEQAKGGKKIEVQ